MDVATVNGMDLEYEVVGTGEPVLLISAVLADGVLPLTEQSCLADRYQLIRYHKRGWNGSSHPEGAVTVADHAADAAALLDHLDAPCAHVVGHSSGALVGAQLALDDPARVKTLSLLELSPLGWPCAQAFVEGAGPVFELYAKGDHETAFAAFMAAVSGLPWEECRALLEDRVPGTEAQAIKDIDTFFGVELPGLLAWDVTPDDLSNITQPVLSIVGQDTTPFWVDVAAELRASLPNVEERTIEGAGHLLHTQQPEAVARVIADFLARHPLNGR